MFRNYLRTTWRSLQKNRIFSFINIVGLAIGIACAAFIFLWVEDEVTYNHYFNKRDNLYKIKDRQTYDGKTFTFDATPGPLAEGIKREIPGIKNTARSSWGDRVLFSLNEKNTYEQGAYVDSSFFSMFQLDFIKGNPAHVFDQLYAVVLSETLAKKYFNSADVIGKTLKINNDQEYIVTGVIKDLPKNVSFKFDWLSPFQIVLNKTSWLKDWGSNGIVTYVETEPNASVDAINKKLYGYIQTKGKDLNARMSIYPMSRWRLYDSYEDGKEVPGRVKYVKLFSLIAWIILLIACINFMNLSTARSEKRAREVGVRKALGANRPGLILQFIAESLIMSFISVLLAITIIYLALPAFNNLVDKQLTVQLFKPVHITALFVITVLCGLIAGSYPAFYLSSFHPVTVLKGLNLKLGNSAGFIRKGLVIAQFAVSVIFIISTIIIYRQIQHVKSRDIGYNKSDLVYMNLTGNMKQNFDVIKNDLLQTGLVENACLSHNLVLNLGSNSGNFSWEGKDPSKEILITIEAASPEYVSTLGMQIRDGRDFYADVKSDSNNIIINESLARIINKKNIVGSVISRGDGSRYTVVGVVKDFLYNDMYSSPAPLILFSDKTKYVNELTVRLKPRTDLKSALAKMEDVVKKDNPGYPVEYKFVDDTFSKMFQSESLIGTLAGLFAVLAILISCLGLFGLAAFTAEQRKKEIGIRKVLGASVQGMAALLSKEFLQLVGIACLVAFPIAWWMMHNWLQGYNYRVEISWWIFVAAGVLSVLIALLTVCFQAIKAAIANPVKSLRTE
ncbi:ABC transporter permease [Danxiaibacter flavus]|uniref:ABC transporter permease n=1 Tax=Danxiaibacter flavus TaxID=3049108 RepID=A0ABV3ZDN3_9BACT|nr:ABC transporter permease [Chitinophagaceae bacterium DXS]